MAREGGKYLTLRSPMVKTIEAEAVTSLYAWLSTAQSRFPDFSILDRQPPDCLSRCAAAL